MEPLDALTVAHSWHGRPQTKRIGRDRDGLLTKQGFSREGLYTFKVVPVFGAEDLAATLERLSHIPTACALRGEPLPGIPTPAQRLFHPNGGSAPTLGARPRRVVALDVDGVDQGTAEDPAFDPEDGVERVIGLLADHADPSFADAS